MAHPTARVQVFEDNPKAAQYSKLITDLADGGALEIVVNSLAAWMPIALREPQLDAAFCDVFRAYLSLLQLLVQLPRSLAPAADAAPTLPPPLATVRPCQWSTQFYLEKARSVPRIVW